MTQKDQTKLLRHGFMIIRGDLHKMCIKVKTANYPEWRIYEKDFNTKRALFDRMEELLENEMIVEE